ncbi:LysR family transcriptional regulator [Mycobacterium barrassiae]|uniref:LysR family transcriptional regulator n=1 Tax=Mycobacterium barrassiae TaxID=319709 RepID=UPI002265A370|nr:LysR family transcriptional regulator [Mycobacterium barrassiae]MCV7299286.1 LysR family transcriptional regulator [Mycobacterium barrassiae]
MNDEAVTEVLPYLPVLVALGDVEHVTTAASMLRMPQPTVSRIVRRLEERLGVKLIEPVGRGVRLTDSARAFIPYAERALESVSDGLESLRSREESWRATVRIAFQTSLGERFVPELIKAARQSHPGMKFVLSQGARRTCLDTLMDGGTDIALVSRLKPPPEGLNTIHLFDQPLCVLVSVDHRWAHKTALRIRNLASEPIITLKPDFGLRGSVEELFSAANVLPTIAFEGDDLHTMRGLVASGLGIAIAPRESVVPRGCVQIPITDRAARRDIGAAVVRNRATSPAVRVVLDLLAKHHFS